METTTLTGTLGHVGMPGAPVMTFHLSLAWNTRPIGHEKIARVAGHVAVGPVTTPIGLHVYATVTGTAYRLGSMLAITLTGHGIENDPPAEWVMQVPVDAFILLPDGRRGSGSFSYARTVVADVPAEAR